MERPTIALIGSREITPAERAMMEATGAWLAERGFDERSGGADGSDQAWIRGGARVAPERCTVCLPADDRRHRARAPRGTHVLTPEYPQWAQDLAEAEYVLMDIRLADHALRARHEQLAEIVRQIRAGASLDRERLGDPGRWTRLSPYVQQLMIRNASIAFVERDRPVSAALGVLNQKRGGGGTGHAFRLLRAAGVPAFDMRIPAQKAQARSFIEALAVQWRASHAPPGALEVVNHHHLGGATEGTLYIGRGGRGEAQSPLANPRRLGDPKPGGGVWDRGDTLEQFRTDLLAVLDPSLATARWWQQERGQEGQYRTLTPAQRDAIVREVLGLEHRVRRGERVQIRCFCSPQACHGDVIKQVVEGRIADR